MSKQAKFALLWHIGWDTVSMKWLIGSEAILSARSGIGEFSGSFSSIQFCHAGSFLLIRSGRSLKVTLLFFENRWLDRALRFDYVLTSIHENCLALSSFTPAPAFNKNWTLCGISLPSSIRIFNEAISLNVILCFSESPQMIYL